MIKEWIGRHLEDLLEGAQNSLDWRAYIKFAAIPDAHPTGNS